MTQSAPIEKPKFPRPTAIAVARDLVKYLNPHCERLIVAGSLRRRKSMVGDIEIVYIPKLARIKDVKPGELFSQFEAPATIVNYADVLLDSLTLDACLIARKNSLGSVVWGEKNKFATHVGTGIPIDLFSATEDNWWNYIVCRTGSAANNIRIAAAAQAKGWKWNPYGAGFTDQEGILVPVHSEQDVFSHVGLPYLEPWLRI